MGFAQKDCALYTMNIVWVSGNQNDTISEAIKYVGKKVVVVKKQINKIEF
jgi:alpha-D-xyloside xylohydrolase